MANSKYNVTNSAKGFRGLNAVSGYIELNPGETREGVEMTTAEYENAKSTGYFRFGDEATPAADEGGEKALPTTHKGLDELAAAEGVAFGDDVTTVAAKQAAITAARASKAAGDNGGGGAAPDELDRMSDDDLRTTAAALSGKTEDELKDTDRDGLLKLARGQE